MPSPGQVGPNEILSRVALLLTSARRSLQTDPSAAGREIGTAIDLLSNSVDRPPRPAGGADYDRSTLAPWQRQRVIEYLEANIETSVRVEDLAMVARLSTSYFFRAFKRSFGMSPHAYVLRFRLDRALRLLMRSDAQLSSIAAECGFSDQAHFSRIFRREIGCAPGNWRRELRTRLDQVPAGFETVARLDAIRTTRVAGRGLS